MSTYNLAAILGGAADPSYNYAALAGGSETAPYSDAALNGFGHWEYYPPNKKGYEAAMNLYKSKGLTGRKKSASSPLTRQKMLAKWYERFGQKKTQKSMKHNASFPTREEWSKMAKKKLAAFKRLLKRRSKWPAGQKLSEYSGIPLSFLEDLVK